MKIINSLFLTLLLAGCGSSTPSIIDNTVFIPKANSTFDWNLQDVDENSSFAEDIDIVDVDAFNTSKETIEALHKRGKKVIAYLSVGSWEVYRPDKDTFPQELLGTKYPGWEEERLLNIKRLDLLAPIMIKRFDMIKSKGFDGIEPDNIDVYTWDSDTNYTGFALTLEDAKHYVDWLIDEAHKRGLSIGQKNAQELSQEYANKFDWALSENAFTLGEEEGMHAYSILGKAVFATEYIDYHNDTNITAYTEKRFKAEVCQKASTLGYTAILKKRNLDSFIIPCP